MLAERLRDRGYRTAAVVANPWLRGEFGFEQGFDTYVALDCGDLCDGKDVVREALGWLEKNSSSPFFLYLHFNDRLADAHRTKGFLQLFFEWDFQGALRSLERSVELDPSSALSHLWLSFCAWEGREDASLEALRKVQELDPLNLYIISVAAGVLDFWGSTEEAVRECRKALDVDGNYLLALYFIGGFYSRLGKHDEAVDALAKAAALSSRAPFYLGGLGWAQGRVGRRDDARACLDELEERSKTEYVAPLHRAIVHAGLGDKDRAFELLDEAVEKRNCWVAIPRVAFFVDLRSDPGFEELLKRLGHPDGAQRR